MDLSLVICTRNRGSRLGPCLSALKRLQYSGLWEIIVVDNNSTDDTRQHLEAFVAEAPCPSHYVLETAPGLANARNAGWRRAKGAIVAFTDDDCYVAPDLVARTVEAFSDPEVGYVGGRIRLFDPEDAPVTILESDQPRSFAPGCYVRAGEIQGANMAFRRCVLEALGGFDPLFGSGAHFPAEDIDAVAGASHLGWAGRYDPSIIVDHHHGRKAADIPRLMRDYDRGRGAYIMKLLVKRGRLSWFATGFLTNLKRSVRSPRGALREFGASLEYLWRAAVR